MRSRPINHQHGIVLLVLMVILALGTAWLVVAATNDFASRTAAERETSAAALNQAKQALIAWIATKAMEAGENNPGRLPCPEPAEYVGNAACEGIAAPGTCEGISAPSCSMVGRLPWRTLGLDKLTDSAGEPLWYAVSPGWSLSNSSSVLTINSDSQGQLSLDGQSGAALAVIFAPGRAMNAQSAPGCTPRNQQRNPTAAPDVRDYLECDNASVDASFVTTGPAPAFNDQVARITSAEVMPVLEAAIAMRIERDIAPALRSAYTATGAGSGSWYGLSSNYYPNYPFAAPFTNPATSDYRGAVGTLQGLLPLATNAANPGLVAWNPTASSAWHSWSYTGVVNSYDCLTWFSATELWCEANYWGRPVFGFWAQAYNVGNLLRAFNPSAVLAAGGESLTWYEGYLDYDGSAWIYVEVVLPERAVDGTHWFNLPIGFLVDHPLLDANNATTGWFVRNQWHRFSYYAISEGFAPGWNSQCDTTGNPGCLSISSGSTNAEGRRAILALTGRGLNGQVRPSANLADYLESAANRDGNTSFEQKPVNATVNDRIVALDANP